MCISTQREAKTQEPILKLYFTAITYLQHYTRRKVASTYDSKVSFPNYILCMQVCMYVCICVCMYLRIVAKLPTFYIHMEQQIKAFSEI
jgi:hypothetical protein